MLIGRGNRNGFPLARPGPWPRPRSRFVAVLGVAAPVLATSIRLSLICLICVLSLAVSACAGATSRTARPLEISHGVHGVLACIPSDEGEAVEIDAAGVSAITVDGRTPPKPWSIVLDPDHPPHRLAPGECLAYGNLPDGYTEVIAPAELEEDWPYSFAIRSPAWGKHGTRNHAVDFCVRRSGGRWLSIDVPEGPTAITVQICKSLLDAASSGNL